MRRGYVLWLGRQGKDFLMLTVSWCVLWCLARSDEFENALGQPRCWQRYGFSPVCDRMWIFRFSSLENALLHPGNWKKEKKKKKVNCNTAWSQMIREIAILCKTIVNCGQLIKINFGTLTSDERNEYKRVSFETLVQ